MAEYFTEQNLRLSKMLLEKQGEINDLKAEVARLTAELAEARKPTPVLVGATGDRWTPITAYVSGPGPFRLPRTREWIEELFGPVTEGATP